MGMHITHLISTPVLLWPVLDDQSGPPALPVADGHPLSQGEAAPAG